MAYQPAGAGQSGSTQSVIGGLAGLDSGNLDNYTQQFYNKALNDRYNGYQRFFKPKELKDLFARYGAAYSANNPLAQQNADFYGSIARGILGDNTSAVDTYERLRSGNLSELGNYFKNIADYGTAGLKGRLAAGGLGNTTGSSYDRILNSTLTSANLAPILSNIFTSLPTATANTWGADKSWDAYRLGALAQDPLTGYVDNATAGRIINPFLTSRGIVNADINSLGRLGELYRANSAGWQLEPGLATKLNTSAAGVMNGLQFGTSMYGSMAGLGGGSGGMGGMGGGDAGAAPQASFAPYSTGMSYDQAPTVSGGPQFTEYYPGTAYRVPDFSGVGNYSQYTGAYGNSPALY